MGPNRVWILAIVAAVMLVTVMAFSLGFRNGFQSGKIYTISNSVFYIADFDPYTDPDGNDYELSLYIDLDGDEYVQGLNVC